MQKIRWDRVLAVTLIMLSPLIIKWLWKTIYIGPFENISVFGQLSRNPELKALLLLAIILVSVLLILKSMRKP